MKFVAKVVAAVYSVRIAFGVLLLAAVAAAAFVISRADFRENIFDLLPVHDDVVDAHVYAGHAFRAVEHAVFQRVGFGRRGAFGTPPTRSMPS